MFFSIWNKISIQNNDLAIEKSLFHIANFTGMSLFQIAISISKSLFGIAMLLFTKKKKPTSPHSLTAATFFFFSLTAKKVSSSSKLQAPKPNQTKQHYGINLQHNTINYSPPPPL